MKKTVFTLLLGFSFSYLIAGGGWPQPKKGGFFKIAQAWIIANQHFTDTGSLDPNTTFATYTSSFYGEYGITDRLTAIAYVPFFTRSLFNNTVSGTTGEVLNSGEAINSIGDIDLSLKYGLITNKPVVLSATLLFGLPTGNPSGGVEQVLQTGDGEFNQMIQFDVSTGKTFGNVNTWYSVSVGFNNRTNDFSDEFRYGLEAGASLFDNKLLTILRFIGVESLRNGLPSAFSNSTSLFANNAEYLAIAPEIAYNINSNFGVSVGVSGALYGRIILAAPTYSFGVYMTI